MLAQVVFLDAVVYPLEVHVYTLLCDPAGSDKR